MVYVMIIVSLLSFVFTVGIGASDDGVDCAMGGEVVAFVVEAHRFGAEVVVASWALSWVGALSCLTLGK
jgi:hypothetical protein